MIVLCGIRVIRSSSGWLSDINSEVAGSFVAFADFNISLTLLNVANSPIAARNPFAAKLLESLYRSEPGSSIRQIPSRDAMFSAGSS